jgi:hypothetical protein
VDRRDIQIRKGNIESEKERQKIRRKRKLG